MPQEQTILPNGTIIQDKNDKSYKVEAMLGQGGFSAVYRIKEQDGQKNVFALKEIIDPDPQGRYNLTLEAEILMRLDHRSLPHVYQVFENVRLNRIFMLMDFIDGINLEVLRREQPEQRFSFYQAFAFMTPIVDAVSYLHNCERPIVHRDIKPANIIIPTSATEALLVDFGLAKEYVADKTTGVFRYGTPGYAAPEQYVKGTNQRTDVYALGATFYTLLTGLIPVDALSRSINQQDGDPLKSAREICPVIPAAISKIIDQAMSLRTASRFATVEEFWQALCSAATQHAYSIPDQFVNQANRESLDAFDQVSVAVPLQEPKPLLTQPIASPHHSTMFWRCVLLFITLIMVIAASLSIWYSPISSAVVGGTRVSQSPSVLIKHDATTAPRNSSATIVSSTVIATVIVGKGSSASSTPVSHINISTPSPSPTQTNQSTPSPSPTQTNQLAPMVDCISGSPSTLTFTSLKKGTSPSPNTVTLTNCGGHSAWTASLQTDDGGSWLSISLSKDTLPLNGSENIQVAVQDTLLAYGTYEGSIHFSQGTASWSVNIVNIVQKK